ncbi:hypothetical protein GOODEAATRI_007343, partial [Goodea atripinnis]
LSFTLDIVYYFFPLCSYHSVLQEGKYYRKEQQSALITFQHFQPLANLAVFSKYFLGNCETRVLESLPSWSTRVYLETHGAAGMIIKNMSFKVGQTMIICGITIEFTPAEFVVTLSDGSTIHFTNRMGAEKYSVTSFDGEARIQSIEIK